MDTILLHPAYFPSVAQMVAVVHCKQLVFEAEDNYQKQTYRTRAYIAHSNGKLLLNVPIQHTGDRQRTKEVLVEDSFPWQSQHWKSLQAAYRTSPFFEFYEDDLKVLFERKVETLWEHNLTIFETLCDLIGIEKDYSTTDEYFKDPTQQDLRYLSDAKTERNFELEPYIQVFQERHGFLENLSVLDLLFNQGPNTLHYLESQDIPFKP
ncbi:WbqC family protein [Luteirhabdus pelagi]|uniref:WbqC family protein n=1 Tax=Luteirhabdus pelagi TaxID=2792783 RepID=UPI0019397050|nr:WbqC family protein [Luteirhabdus pelagi]